jgi:peptidoglycan/xylan/chitin deacetylase (PgdA/CDA1 family)
MHGSLPGTLPGSLVVTYHYVRPENSEGVTGVSPDEFDAQLAAIGQSHRFVTVHEFIAMHDERARHPQRDTGGDPIALVTFDDALRDQYEFAADVLDRRGVPAVFFAPMRPFADDAERGENRSPWTTQHLLHALAEELGWRELERRVDEALGPVPIDAAAMNHLYHYEVESKRRLKYTMAFALPEPRARGVLQWINQSVGLLASEWFMSAHELLELQSSGHAVGGHGFDHVAFSNLTPREQAAEMQRSQAVMSRLLGAMPRSIAFPFGRSTSETAIIALGCGYTHCFTTENRVDAKYLDATLGVLVA